MMIEKSNMKGDEMKTMAECLSKGLTACIDKNIAARDIAWVPHPTFKGVSLKHLIKGMETGGLLSSHMVRLEPHAVLEEHTHDNQWELHEVIEGEGCFLLDSKEVIYVPGNMGIIPKKTRHKVVAGESGLVLMAKFFPALL
jgi:quercetin dioxygenase-like cupin family protein